MFWFTFEQRGGAICEVVLHPRYRCEFYPTPFIHGCLDELETIRVELRSKRVKGGVEKAMEFRKVGGAVWLTLLSTQGIHGSPRSYGDTRQTQARPS